MNKTEYLLTVLAEECTEVTHAVTKSLRFGLDDKWKDNPTNKQQISQEMADVMGTFFYLLQEGIIDPPEESLVQAKKEKIDKFMQYSRERGTLV